MLRAALLVDVETVGRVVYDRHLSTQFGEDGGSNLVGGSVGCIEDDLQTLHRQTAGKGVLEEHYVASGGIGQPVGAAYLVRRRHHLRQPAAQDEFLDLLFLFV